MRASPPTTGAPHRFDLPAGFLHDEQRLSGHALHAWKLSQQASVPGFEANSLTIAEPGGRALILTIAPDIANIFSLSVGQSLIDLPSGDQSIAGEMRAACDLVALGGRPISLEASISAPEKSLMLVRGIVLPLRRAGVEIDVVQTVLSWREVLNRSATDRLRRELGSALRAVSASNKTCADPFPQGRVLQNKHKVRLG